MVLIEFKSRSFLIKWQFLFKEVSLLIDFLAAVLAEEVRKVSTQEAKEKLIAGVLVNYFKERLDICNWMLCICFDQSISWGVRWTRVQI